jgi:hypothetical protein
MFFVLRKTSSFGTRGIVCRDARLKPRENRETAAISDLLKGSPPSKLRRGLSGS